MAIQQALNNQPPKLPAEWVQNSSSTLINKFVDDQLNIVTNPPEAKVRVWQILFQYDRKYSCMERTARGILAVAAIVGSLFIALFFEKSKKVILDYLLSTKDAVYYGNRYIHPSQNNIATANPPATPVVPSMPFIPANPDPTAILATPVVTIPTVKTITPAPSFPKLADVQLPPGCPLYRTIGYNLINTYGIPIATYGTPNYSEHEIYNLTVKEILAIDQSLLETKLLSLARQMDPKHPFSSNHVQAIIDRINLWDKHCQLRARFKALGEPEHFTLRLGTLARPGQDHFYYAMMMDEELAQVDLQKFLGLHFHEPQLGSYWRRRLKNMSLKPQVKKGGLPVKFVDAKNLTIDFIYKTFEEVESVGLKTSKNNAHYLKFLLLLLDEKEIPNVDLKRFFFGDAQIFCAASNEHFTPQQMQDFMSLPENPWNQHRLCYIADNQLKALSPMDLAKSFHAIFIVCENGTQDSFSMQKKLNAPRLKLLSNEQLREVFIQYPLILNDKVAWHHLTDDQLLHGIDYEKLKPGVKFEEAFNKLFQTQDGKWRPVLQKMPTEKLAFIKKHMSEDQCQSAFGEKA